MDLDHFNKPARTEGDGLENESRLQGDETTREAKGLETTFVRRSDHSFQTNETFDLLRRRKGLIVAIPEEPVRELGDVVADAFGDRGRERMVPKLGEAKGLEDLCVKEWGERLLVP